MNARLALGLRLAFLAEVEVKARLLRGLHPLPGALADAEIRQTGRNHHGFLRAADEDVDAAVVHVKMRGAEAGNRVDHQQRVGSLQQRGDRLNVMARASGGFRRLHVENGGAVELGADFAEIEGLTIGSGDQFNLAVESLGQIAPALAKLAGGEHDDLVTRRGEIGDGGFHGAAAGGSKDQNIILGADEGLEISHGAAEDLAELGGAVMHVCGRNGVLRGRKKRSRAGSK